MIVNPNPCLIQLATPLVSIAEVQGKQEEKTKMKRHMIPAMVFAICVAAPSFAGNPFAGNPMVGGQKMYANKDIIDNAVHSADHTTLVAAVKAAGLVDTLKGAGPFTVFAPTNEAFAKLPAGTVDTLLKPENKDALVRILTYHVVPGRLTMASLEKQIRDGGGMAELKTVSGGTLTASMQDGKLMLRDEKSGMSVVR